MPKLAVIVLADTETHADLGRVVNALETVKEFQDAGDDVALVFDGAGTRWVAVLDDPGHKRHALWSAVKGSVDGACSFCSVAFGAEEGVRSAGVRLLAEHEGHPSLRAYVVDGYQVLTF
ncbi:MAG: hypothetical protein R6W77_03185 [Trueperaceae bacterium]